ncbi:MULTISPECIES: peptidoglycan DD-metalloendopeptidase family protein [unclassified Arcicella]|uniref:peptidoglycan DD-metalloendopeptidase family protein n=1 Tax=unclassified Arcicella TaxID=2644986 RepID=UPI002866EF24|nr:MULTISPECIES: peptidoglycan DD-metalloendopeptidase family protein [unclassified Arcicella]MDR6560102.1 murein DD-endopeptidase MepM/ murein hydrolase activator NlpD [Arcicella sp. BE51]MDR6810291.1 murein DD-endopeptidase MepM/ murein hydrolase activator NlpD [Arcicella sp. BE140]MDR6821641.1 murein DD-endopeptidase MepM/ murein hydrolase activator NlpD [Arcicella sp. BE139]
MNTIKKLLVLVFCLVSFISFSQESGSFKKNPKINVKTNAKDKSNKNLDEALDELPKLQFRTDYVPEPVATSSAITASSKFEPAKELNSSISIFDTTSVDEREPLIVEIEEETRAEGSDDFVSVATYFSIWDATNIDPYDINPKDFDDVVDIELFNKEQGRYWSVPNSAPKLTSVFGPRWGRMHSGVDLDLETGDPVYAAFDGIVRVSGYDGGGYGKFLVVRHYNGLETLYGHLSAKNFESGAYVKAGDQIGLGGSTGRSTGSHLHFETRYEGNPFNPAIYVFNFSGERTEPVSDHVLISARVFDTYGLSLDNEYGSSARKVKTRRTAWTTVRSGDSLYSIANRAGISVDKLARMNGMRISASLRIGRRLRIH